MFKGLCARQNEILAARGEFFQPMEHAHRDLLSAHGASAAVCERFLRREPQSARAVPVQMIFSLFGKKFYRSPESFPRFERAFERGIGKRRGDEIAFPAEFCGRMRVRIGNERIAVQGGNAAVHGRIGRQPRFERADVRREISETLLYAFKARKRAEHRKVRRPDMRGDENGVRTDVQREREKLLCGNAEDGPAVRTDVAHLFEFERKPFRRVERGQKDHAVHLAHPAVLFINGADLSRNDKAGRDGKFADIAQPFAFRQAVKALFRGHEFCREFFPPGGVREIPRAHEADALAPRPEIEVIEVAVFARRP